MGGHRDAKQRSKGKEEKSLHDVICFIVCCRKTVIVLLLRKGSLFSVNNKIISKENYVKVDELLG